MTLPILVIARTVLGGKVIPIEDLDRRFKAWIGILMSAFLARNFWLYIAISGALMLWAASKDKNPLAVFLGLFFVVPPTATYIPGFGPINYIIEIHHLRLASLIILGGLYLRLRKEKLVEPYGFYMLDWLVLSYLALQVILSLRSDPTITTVFRTSVELFIDGFLPYFVTSRAARNIAALRDIFVSFLLAILLMAPITIFELGKGWLLFTSINEGLGLGWDIMPYIMRNGNVRPYAATGNSLVLGFVLAVGLGLYPAIRPLMNIRTWQWSCGLLIAALCASLARGSYIGAAAAVLVAAGSGRGAASRLSKLALIAGFAFIGVLLSPFSEKVASYLPFIGDVDTDNVTYRTRLFDVSMQVISMNPLFGSANFMQEPLMQQMRQGQGIIDIVNSYLGVALGLGYVGLSIYFFIYIASLVKIWSSIRQSMNNSLELEGIGRALLGTVVGVMVIIATTSCYLSMPFVIWILIGISVRYSGVVASMAQPTHREASAVRSVKQGYRQSQGKI